MNMWGSVQRAGKEERNNILQKAITLYVAEIKNLKMDNSKISFMAVKEKATRDNDTYEVIYGGTAEQLQAYSITTLPPNGIWIELRPGLSFRQSTIEPNQEGESKITKNTIRFEFRGDNPDGEKKVDAFIQVPPPPPLPLLSLSLS
jgi:mitochondrial chaperone BCS1